MDATFDFYPQTRNNDGFVGGAVKKNVETWFELDLQTFSSFHESCDFSKEFVGYIIQQSSHQATLNSTYLNQIKNLN